MKPRADTLKDRGIVNPYAPPNHLRRDIDSFASKYRVDCSRTTLREFCNLSNRRVFGAMYWFALRLRIVKFNQQVLDGPKPFEIDVCDFDEIKDPVRSFLKTNATEAERYGFHSPRASLSHSAGIEVHGGALHMLHRSGQMFLAIIASSNGDFTEGSMTIVSASRERNPQTYSTTNNRPNFRSLADVHVARYPGRPLGEIFRSHADWVHRIDVDLMRIDTVKDIGDVVDHLSVMYYADKVDRGIFVPEPEHTNT